MTIEEVFNKGLFKEFQCLRLFQERYLTVYFVNQINVLQL